MALPDEMGETGARGESDVFIIDRHTDRGRISVSRLRPGVLHSTTTGHIDRTIVEVLIQTTESEMAAQPAGVEHFLDWGLVQSYDSEARVLATKWALTQKAPYPQLHIVTKSRLVNMGVAAASLTLVLAGRPLRAYLSMDSFASALNGVQGTRG